MPCEFPSEGKLSGKSHNHISQEFFVLHKDFPNERDQMSNSITVQEDAEKFFLGEDTGSQLIKSRLIPMLDIGSSI